MAVLITAPTSLDHLHVVAKKGIFWPLIDASVSLMIVGRTPLQQFTVSQSPPTTLPVCGQQDSITTVSQSPPDRKKQGISMITIILVSAVVTVIILTVSAAGLVILSRYIIHKKKSMSHAQR